VQYIRYISSKY